MNLNRVLSRIELPGAGAATQTGGLRPHVLPIKDCKPIFFTKFNNKHEITKNIEQDTDVQVFSPNYG